MKRRFEFVGGTSAKFYEVEVAGNSVNTRYGRIDSPGQSQAKSFNDPTAAMKHANKLIEQKLAKGYVELAAA